MRGLPGSGKSTYVKNNYPNAEICSADHFFYKLGNGEYKYDATKIGEAHKECFSKFMEAISCGKETIAIDNVFTTRWEISPYIALANHFGYDHQIIKMETPLAVCLSRQTHKVPDKHMEWINKGFEKSIKFWKEKTVKGF